MRFHIFSKLIIIVYIVLLVYDSKALAQNQLEWLKSLNNPELYTITTENGELKRIKPKNSDISWVKNFTETDAALGDTVADLVIDLRYSDIFRDTLKYKYWKDVPFYSWRKMVIADANKNLRREVYGRYYDHLNKTNNCRIDEYQFDSSFSTVALIDKSIRFIYDINDITDDGLFELVASDGNNKIHIFSQSNANGYPIFRKCVYHLWPKTYQPNDITFFDIDSDGNKEIIYFLDAGDKDSIWAYANHIAKYNPLINNYELVYFHRPIYYAAGLSFGDFDLDGKQNFSTGGGYGDWYVYEHQSGNIYNVRKAMLPIYNLYLTTFTNDIDGNGKPELWVGGDGYSSSLGGITRIFAFEADGDNNYQIVFQIDIIGLFSFNIGRMDHADIDGDGKDEVMLQNGRFMFLFENIGLSNYRLKLLVVDPVREVYNHAELEGSGLTDIDLDGRIEPYFFYRIYEPRYSYVRGLTVFVKVIEPTKVDDQPNAIKEYKLIQNYPNPFNSRTKIKFELPELTKVKIQITDLLGREIAELINETRNSGVYELEWNGKDKNGNNLNTGIYFICLETNKFKKTIKSVLIK